MVGNLFTRNNGHSMIFRIGKGSQKDLLYKLIQSFGGKILEFNETTTTKGNSALIDYYIISKELLNGDFYPEDNLEACICVDENWVIDSVFEGYLLPIDKYIYTLNDQGPPPKPTQRKPFSAAEDELLIRLVEMMKSTKGFLPNGNKLYEAIVNQFEGRTAQSLRSRYLQTLRPYLDNQRAKDEKRPGVMYTKAFSEITPSKEHSEQHQTSPIFKTDKKDSIATKIAIKQNGEILEVEPEQMGLNAVGMFSQPIFTNNILEELYSGTDTKMETHETTENVSFSLTRQKSISGTGQRLNPSNELSVDMTQEATLNVQHQRDVSHDSKDETMTDVLTEQPQDNESNQDDLQGLSITAVEINLGLQKSSEDHHYQGPISNSLEQPSRNDDDGDGVAVLDLTETAGQVDDERPLQSLSLLVRKLFEGLPMDLSSYNEEFTTDTIPAFLQSLEELTGIAKNQFIMEFVLNEVKYLDNIEDMQWWNFESDKALATLNPEQVLHLKSRMLFSNEDNYLFKRLRWLKELRP